MNRIPARLLGYGAGLLLVRTLGWILTGHAAKPLKPEIPLPTDWTHNHVIFTQPATEEQARIMDEDPRYWHEVYRQGQSKVLNPEVSEPMAETTVPGPDWSQNLGNAAATGIPSANMQAKKRSAVNLVQIHIAQTNSAHQPISRLA